MKALCLWTRVSWPFADQNSGPEVRSIEKEESFRSLNQADSVPEKPIGKWANDAVY